MQVRLGFATAIQVDADVYLVDEVLAVGDVRFQQKCFDTFRRLKREGRTVVFVTHDLGTVERFCDRALLLEHGIVAALGEPREVIQEYRGRAFLEERVEARDEGRLIRWGDGSAEILRRALLRRLRSPGLGCRAGDWVTLRVLCAIPSFAREPDFRSDRQRMSAWSTHS